MPRYGLVPGVEMRYLIDNSCDPWSDVDTVVLVEGIAESELAWYGWVRALASRFRVLRSDLCGFGKSTPLPESRSPSPECASRRPEAPRARMAAIDPALQIRT